MTPFGMEVRLKAGCWIKISHLIGHYPWVAMEQGELKTMSHRVQRLIGEGLRAAVR